MNAFLRCIATTALLAILWPGVVGAQEPVPPVTDEDRAAAFPAVGGHAVHEGINYFVLFDQLEWQSQGGGESGSWDTRGWVGGDRNRFWFRTEGDARSGRVAATQTHLLLGRSIARWWDVVAGIRQDIRPGPAQTWAAIGIQGIAPYWFDVQATAYVGGAGRTHVRMEAEHDMLITNRLVLQSIIETEVYGKSDPEHGFASGLTAIDAGLRVRYEFRREFAPYVGVVWSRKFFGTGDLAEAAGEKRSTASLALGVRTWF